MLIHVTQQDIDVLRAYRYNGGFSKDLTNIVLNKAFKRVVGIEYRSNYDPRKVIHVYYIDRIKTTLAYVLGEK